MGGPEFRDRQLSQLLLKRERRMQLYQPRRGVGSEERTEDAGGGGYRIYDPPEGLCCNIGIGLIEMRTVEDVKELRPYPEVSTFPMRDIKHLGDREVGVEKPRTSELVPAVVSESSARKTES